MAVVFPNLIAEIAKRGIKKTAIAERIGVSTRTLYSKLGGETSFSWEEVCEIKNCFFPDMDQETLFKRADDKGA